MKYKALAIRQPWASLVACGRKTIEIRSRLTKVRGDVLICAPQPMKGANLEIQSRFIREETGLEPLYSKAICLVELVDTIEITYETRHLVDQTCIRLEDPEFEMEEDEYILGWVFKNPRLIKPFDVKCCQRLQQAPFSADRTRRGARCPSSGL